jgi:hypothetical protein
VQKENRRENQKVVRCAAAPGYEMVLLGKRARAASSCAS